MIYSQTLNLLYIAVPKTGTTSVERAIRKIDPKIEFNGLTLGEIVIKGIDLKKGVLGHARAKEIKEVVPEDFFKRLNILATIREPRSKLVSAYFFTKNNKLIKSKYIKIRSVRLFINEVKYVLGVLLAKLLPFQLWAFLYPYRSNCSYIFDDKGNRLVNYIARTEYLDTDIKLIFTKLGFDISNLEIEILNTSKHKDYSLYYKNRLFNKLISKRMKKDINFYQEVGLEIRELQSEVY